MPPDRDITECETASLAEDIFVLKVRAYCAALANNLNRKFRRRHGIELEATYFLGDSGYPKAGAPWAWVHLSARRDPEWTYSITVDGEPMRWNFEGEVADFHDINLDEHKDAVAGAILQDAERHFGLA